MQKEISKAVAFLESLKGFWFILLSILLFNTILYFNSIPNQNYFDQQQRKDATGFEIDYAKKFFYFYYYTGDFPLATLNDEIKYSKIEAKKEIEDNGQNLIMEYKHWSRLGENARIWAFLPNAFISGSPESYQIRLFNSIVFVVSLSLLYLGFWRLKKVSFGILLIALINFTPFFIFETFVNENIFALLGSVFFIVLGLNVYSLYEEEKKSIFLLLTAISAATIGFFSEFRNEISIVFVSLILICLFAKSQRLIVKMASLGICFLIFFGTKYSIRIYFDYKFQKTTKLVNDSGGHIYTGKRIAGHNIWHPIYCGFGDFDEKYGYEWNDKLPYKYATPILKEKYGLDLHYSNKYYLDDYYDKDSLYYMKFDEIHQYETIIKHKVLSQIKNDPSWYSVIILKRILRTLSNTIPVPFVGWLIFYVVYFLYRHRFWFYLKLIAISLPLSASSILIYSGKGATYNSVFVYFVIIGLVVILKNKREILSNVYSKIFRFKYFF